MKRRKRASELPLRLCKTETPDFVPNDSFWNLVEQNPCFFGRAKKRTARCCRYAALAKTRPADESYIYYIGAPQTSEI